MYARLRRELCVLALAALGCRPEPLRPIVEKVEIDGLGAVDAEPIREGLATAETPRFLGLFEGVLEYSTYDSHVLERDLLRIERYLRARGYYEAKVIAARVVHLGDNRVRVELHVNEGLPVRVTKVDAKIATLPEETRFPVNEAKQVLEGQIFDEQRFEEDKARIERTLLDMGYAFAKVEGTARVNVAAHTAELSYHIAPGPRSRYGPVTFVGLKEIPEAPVRAALKIQEGRRYSETDLEEARGELADLGVFSTVDVVADRSHPESQTVPIEVRVREAALRTLRVGGGVRFDVLQLLTRLQTGWEHRNFLGGMRRLSVNARPGLTFYPTRIGLWQWPTRLLPENRVEAMLSQPSFIEGRTTGTLTTSYEVKPVLYPLQNIDPEQDKIIGYQQVGARGGVLRRFFRRRVNEGPSRPRLSIELAYNWQANFPFMYQGQKPDGLDPLTLAFPELVTTLDLRDDPLHTRCCFYFSNSLQVARRNVFGGEVSDVKVTPEVRGYLPREGFMLGARLRFGFLFPGNYGQTLTDPDPPPPSDVRVIHDQQRLQLRAYYSGGPTSNRGYPIGTIGPHGPIGFLAPSTNRDCLDFESDERCLRPLGGLTLWEASLEARIPFGRGSSVEGVLFVDASDLTRAVADIRLTVPHISPGAGLRYVTPVGTLRLDVGWRVPGWQAFGKDDTVENIGRPGDPILGFFPGAIHLVFGSEAF